MCEHTMILCSNSSKKKKKKKDFHILNVLSPLSHAIKAQCHWAKDIEHFGTDKLRVLEIEQKRIVYI